jgi:Na+/H+ antiporter NhaC
MRKINDITNALDENFYISGWVLLPALIVMGLAIKNIIPFHHYSPALQQVGQPQ